MIKKALVVGVDKYERAQQLNGCVNDAIAIGCKLEGKEYGFDVQRMTDSEVTRKALRSAINLVLTNADFSLIYFAGHGIRTTVSTFLATVDSEWDDEGVDVHYLVDAVSKLADPNQTVVIILDCCHAGDASIPDLQSINPMGLTDVPTLAGSGRLVLASCLGDQSAKEKKQDGVEHGVFSFHFIEALEGKAADGDSNVTISYVYEYVAKKLQENGRQRPLLRGDQSGRIILGTGIQSTGAFESNSANEAIKDEIISEAEMHIEGFFATIQRIGLKDFDSGGHREACQRFSPIIDWFQHRLNDNGQLIKNASFKRSWNNALQQYQYLSNIKSGVVLDKSREVGEFIGSGTFGAVWKINSSNSIPLCYKSYHSAELRETEKVARFNRGYRAMTQLDHPNIVKVYESTTVPLGFYMQYIEGANLRQYSPANNCDFEQIVEILLEIGETLSHSHGRNVLHRDVKPENILLKVSDDGDINPYLTDFDLSWFSTATQLTRVAGDGFGSHFYAAPEQMNSPGSHAAHKQSVDAYSFGQVMFFAFCGSDPAIFNESGNAKAFSECLGRLSISEKVASLLSSIYRDCTRLTPDKRIDDFRVICDRLSEVLTTYRNTDDNITSNQFLQELRFLITGAISKAEDHALHGNVTVKSPSGRTTVSIIIKSENSQSLAIEATFIPDQSPLINGANSAGARQIVNSRIDEALGIFIHSNHTRRTAPKNGAYQSIVNFDNINKNADGISRCRKLLMGVVDCIERY